MLATNAHFRHYPESRSGRGERSMMVVWKIPVGTIPRTAPRWSDFGRRFRRCVGSRREMSAVK